MEHKTLNELEKSLIALLPLSHKGILELLQFNGYDKEFSNRFIRACLKRKSIVHIKSIYFASE